MWGGGERHTLSLASLLRARGHEVYIIQCGHDQFAPHWPKDRRLSVRTRLPGILTWRRALRMIAPDVVCEVRGGGLPFGGGLDLAAYSLGIRLVPIEHSPYPAPPTIDSYGSRRRFPAHTARLAVHKGRQFIHGLAVTHTIAVANHVAVSASRYLDLPLDDQSVINNGVDPTRFAFASQERARLRSELGLSDDLFIVGAVGRISKEKRLDLLIQAFSSFRSQSENSAALVIAGDGPAESELHRLMDTLHLESAVRFVGYRNDVSALLSSMDVVASTSESEGMSLALLEALATERLCACLPYAGLEEIAFSNPAVHIARSREPTDLANLFTVLSAMSVGARTAVGIQGRDIVRSRFAEQTQLLRIATELEAIA